MCLQHEIIGPKWSKAFRALPRRLFLLLIISTVMLSTVESEPTAIFSCDFETDTCGLQESTSWMRKTGLTSPSSMDAGPEGGDLNSKSYYFPQYIENLNVSEFSTTAFNYTGVVCIQFAYTVYGEDIGKLIVYAGKISAAYRRLIWESGNISSKGWRHESLSYLLSSEESVVWQAHSGRTGNDIAVDSIAIQPGSCSMNQSYSDCPDPMWDRLDGVIFASGVSRPNLNTEELCKEVCIAQANCIAVDIMTNASGIFCFHHSNHSALKDVFHVPNVTQYTRTFACVTDLSNVVLDENMLRVENLAQLREVSEPPNDLHDEKFEVDRKASGVQSQNFERMSSPLNSVEIGFVAAICVVAVVLAVGAVTVGLVKSRRERDVERRAASVEQPAAPESGIASKQSSRPSRSRSLDRAPLRLDETPKAQSADGRAVGTSNIGSARRENLPKTSPVSQTGPKA